MDAAGWDERYRGSERVWKAEPNRFVEEELAGLKPSGRAVDPAAGEGRNAVWLAERGWEVDAVADTPQGIFATRGHGGPHCLTFAPVGPCTCCPTRLPRIARERPDPCRGGTIRPRTTLFLIPLRVYESQTAPGDRDRT